MNFEHTTFRGLDWYEKYGWEKEAIYIIGTREGKVNILQYFMRQPYPKWGKAGA